MVKDDDNVHTLLHTSPFEASKDTFHYAIYVDQRVIDLCEHVHVCECVYMYIVCVFVCHRLATKVQIVGYA